MAESTFAANAAPRRPRRSPHLVALALAVSGVLALPVAASPPVALAVSTTMTLAVHDTHHNVVLGTKVGAPVHARVSLSGTPRPTGTVTVVRYGDGACAGKGLTSKPITLLLGAADVTGFPFLPTATGTYSFGAFYSPAEGSSYTATHTCRAFTVGKATPSVATVFRLVNDGVVTSVELGQLLAIDSTATGPKGVPVPTGTMTLRHYTDSACTQNQTTVSTTLLQNGTARVTWQPQALITRWYRASYAGDARYTSRVGPCTRLSVTKATPAMNGAVHDTDHVTVTSVVDGTPVHAFIRVRGFSIEEAPETLPTGQVRGTWFTTGACMTADGSFGPVHLQTGQVDIIESTRLLPPGTYGLRLQYLGDLIYKGAQTPCLKVTITALPTTPPTAVPTAHPSEATGPSVPPAVTPATTAVPGSASLAPTTPVTASEPAGVSPSPAASAISPPSGDTGATIDPLVLLVVALLVIAAIVIGFAVGARRRRSAG